MSHPGSDVQFPPPNGNQMENQTANLRERVRFGDGFELESSPRRLTRGGRVLRLERIPLELLFLLIERQGEIVSRDEIVSTIWGDGVFIDTDNSIRSAIRKIRYVLKDDPENPRYVQTITGQGYRFIGSSNGTRDSVVADSERTKPKGPPLISKRTRTALALLLVGIAVLTASLFVRRSFWHTTIPTVASSHPLTFGPEVLYRNGFHFAFPQIVTDGSRIYFSVWDDGAKLAQVSLSGGEVSKLPVPFEAYVLDLSTHQGRLLLREISDPAQPDGPLWEVSTTGGNLIRLGNVVAQDAAWSPDGTKLVFSKGNALYLASREGEDARKLLNLDGYAFWIRWSPDGSRLRFTLADKNFSTSLWEVSPGGGDLHPLLPSWKADAHPCCGEWSPDGKLFVFAALTESRSDAWILSDKDSTFRRRQPEPVRLTDGPLSYPTVIFSKDGKRLFAVGGVERGALNRLNLKTRQLEPFLSGLPAWDPHYSRDEQWITYGGSEFTISRSRADGSEALQLTRPPMRAAFPRWSPDGKQIVFVGKTPDGPYKLHLIGRDGGTPKQLIADERNEIDPDWSPDGHTIVFGRPPDIIAEPGMPKAIHLLNLENGQMSTLPGSEGLFSPRWSRDGRHIAAQSVNTPFELMLYDVATQSWKNVGVIGVNQVWAHDSKSFYAFGYDRLHQKGKLPIYRIWLDGRSEELVDLRRAAQPPIRECYCCDGSMPDNSPILNCVSGSSDIFALELKY